MTERGPRGALRRTIAERPVVGTFVKLPGRASIDLAHRGGFDFVVIDLEHSTLDERQAADQVAHAAALGLPAIVRLPHVDAGAINRFLEVGAAGVQLSTLRSTEAARALRAATRHSPEGTRSISLAHPCADYGQRTLAAHLAAERADPPLVIGQIETATTQDPLGELVVPLDIAFVGTTDLAVDLGHGDRPGHREVAERVASITATTVAADRVAGSFASSPADLPALLASGVRYVVLGSDLAALGRALTADAAAARAVVTA